MKPPDTHKGHIVASAALGALSEARWRSRDVLSGKSAEAAPGLLRGHAAELAVSPIGRDQLLGAALLAAADDLERGRPFRFDGHMALPEPPPSEAERTRIRREAFGAGAIPTAESRKVLEDLEVRYRPECGSAAELSARLEADANLHEAVWDDPRLACAPRTRLVMLFSVPKLLDRAEELAPDRTPAASVSPGPAVKAARPRGAGRRWALAYQALQG
jgi:hypothetical protein